MDKPLIIQSIGIFVGSMIAFFALIITGDFVLSSVIGLGIMFIWFTKSIVLEHKLKVDEQNRQFKNWCKNQKEQNKYEYNHNISLYVGKTYRNR